ncbi:hypothetical protein PhCBS80983_g03151 [Powellomyces hirtus]|uniref:PX domain-containing protein n=1 Tax=Powellomyces hirtus TaxID=109895 RepID=A0A507E5S0_9FUNG|nr:hypothetical protein PhCBS80983_g03151 [Powellomyces hirtus]
MVATASSIFKIRAIADFLAPKSSSSDGGGGGETLLSFRQSQAFYVLSTDKVKGLYFVSTQYATPFARTAVSGLVPISHFELVDLLSKDPSPAAKNSQASKAAAAAAAAAGATSKPKEKITKRLYSYLQANVRRHSEGALLAPPVARPEDEEPARRADTIPRNVHPAQRPTAAADASSRDRPLATGFPFPGVNNNDRVIDAEIISAVHRPSRVDDGNATLFTSTPPRNSIAYTLRVARQKSTHVISRTFEDFLILSNSLTQFFGPFADSNQFIPTLPPPVTLSLDDQTLTKQVQEQQKQLAEYMAQLCHGMPITMFESGIVARFFAPRSDEEAAQQGIRRDSGFAQENQPKESSSSSLSLRQRRPSGGSPPRARPELASRHTFQSYNKHALDGVVDTIAGDMDSKLMIQSPTSTMNGLPLGGKTPNSAFDTEDFLKAYS